MKIASKDVFYKTVGLIALANEHYEKMKDIESALGKLLEQDFDNTGYAGHISDCVWGEQYTAEALLSKLNITVNMDNQFNKANPKGK